MRLGHPPELSFYNSEHRAEVLWDGGLRYFSAQILPLSSTRLKGSGLNALLRCSSDWWDATKKKGFLMCLLDVDICWTLTICCPMKQQQRRISVPTRALEIVHYTRKWK